MSVRFFKRYTQMVIFGWRNNSFGLQYSSSNSLVSIQEKSYLQNHVMLGNPVMSDD